MMSKTTNPIGIPATPEMYRDEQDRMMAGLLTSNSEYAKQIQLLKEGKYLDEEMVKTQEKIIKVLERLNILYCAVGFATGVLATLLILIFT
jgi:type IV secretory pathway component VirB8